MLQLESGWSQAASCCSLLQMGQYLTKLTWTWNLKLHGDFSISFSCKSIRMIKIQTRWPRSYYGISAIGQPFIFLQSITSYNNFNFQSILNEAKHTSLGESIIYLFFLQLPLGFSGRSNAS